MESTAGLALVCRKLNVQANRTGDGTADVSWGAVTPISEEQGWDEGHASEALARDAKCK